MTLRLTHTWEVSSLLLDSLLTFGLIIKKKWGSLRVCVFFYCTAENWSRSCFSETKINKPNQFLPQELDCDPVTSGNYNINSAHEEQLNLCGIRVCVHIYTVDTDWMLSNGNVWKQPVNLHHLFMTTFDPITLIKHKPA